jgi:hypothetical protein
MATLQFPGRRWQPRPHQRPLWRFLMNGGKRALAIWHRRAGKDDVCLRWMAYAAGKRPATYWYLLPMQRQARRVIWEAVNPHTGIRRIDEAFPPEIRKKTHEQEMSIELFNGSMVHLLGSDNYNSLVGSPPLGVIFSEWALAKPAAWAFIRPILRENKGWALFVTTPRGKNHAYTMLNASEKRSKIWFTQTLTAMDTDVFDTAALEDEFREYVDEFGIEDGQALFEQEYYCSFESAVRGSYWGREMVQAEREGRVVSDLKPLPNTPVHTSWDIGVDNATAIWFFQVTPNSLLWLNYYEQVGMGVSHFAQKKLELGKRHGYSFVNSIDYVPHDAKQRSWTSTGQDGTARQRIEDMRECGLHPQLVPNHARVDGINAAKKTIGRSYFHKEHTEEGRECLKNYQRLWDADDKVYAKTPFHNWAVNGADSFRYGSMAWRALAKPKPVEAGRMLVSISPTGEMRTGLSFDELRDRNAAKKTGKSFIEMRDRNARLKREAARRNVG